MVDVFSKAKRSEVMSRIRSRGNRDTELALAQLLRANRITGWRRQVEVRIMKRGVRNSGAHGVTRPTFRVKPDFVFPKLKLAVFVDGCFWHGCPRHATKPKNNRVFWQRKLSGNTTRDQIVNQTLRKAGWRVTRVWECDLARRPEVCVRRVQRALI
ncbi:MAG: very short patch repair endonuclease [Verrucomicrobiia bacterium]